MDRAAAACAAARDQAEQHGVAGEGATSQAQRTLVMIFTDPTVADDELHLAEPLLTGLDLRATSLTVWIAALVRDVGIAAAETVLELALAFHHDVLGEQDRFLPSSTGCANSRGPAPTSTTRTSPTTWALALPGLASARWLDGADAVRTCWQRLVQTRRARLGVGG